MWVTVTLLTRPASEKTLERFCRKVKPFAVGWRPVVRAHPDIEWNRRFGRVCLQWTGGTAALFCFCFGIGHLMFLRFTIASILLACAIGLIALVFIPYYTRQAGVKTDAAATDVSVDSGSPPWRTGTPVYGPVRLRNRLRHTIYLARDRRNSYFYSLLLRSPQTPALVGSGEGRYSAWCGHGCGDWIPGFAGMTMPTFLSSHLCSFIRPEAYPCTSGTRNQRYGS